MKRGLVVLVILAGFVAVPLVYALLAEQAVFYASKNERNPAAGYDGVGGEVWAFTRSRSGFPNRYDAYAKAGANSPIKLNLAGQGWTGGMDYPVVPYQQIAGGQSDVHFYDLNTGLRSTPAINTGKWEWHPSISGDVNTYSVLFGRDDINTPTQRVVLHHHPAHEDHVLSSVTRASHYLQPDQLNGDWVTFTRCTPRCNVFKHEISSETTTRIAKPVTTRPRHQYAGAVTATGAVYLVRSGPNCGEKVKIVRYDAAHADPALGTVVAALPSGFDIAFASARENALDGSVDVFYDRVRCSTGRFDIYKVTDPPPGP